ncbi:cytochrome P450 [Rhodocollybia butyracea]|uniref:Cytochrome P450 n=1 Tax=Rhodocollybia butyracea TaxID=206335 RepID=A0A9P5Q1G7_9AGAR|nr:cytochrome P450 [Rhodocollybia butyracea]
MRRKMLTLLIAVIMLVIITFVLKRRDSSLSNLRGPAPSSYILGHEYELTQQSDVGKLEFAWLEKYGPTMRVFGCFSEEVLMIADPMGLQHILQSQNYPKTKDIRLIAERVFGRGLLWATGNAHHRLRRALNPAFSTQQLKHFVPLFQETTTQLVERWKEELKGGSMIFNMAEWIPKITLDVIGRSAFDFKFGVLDGTSKYNELYCAIRDMFLDSKSPSTVTVIYSALRRRLPESLSFKLFTTKEDRRLSAFLTTAQATAKVILVQKLEAQTPGPNNEGDKDILSVLVRALSFDDARRRLTQDEIISQMATILLAGHETSSGSMSWMLYELSKHPESQTTLYEEIAALRARIGYDTPLKPEHYDSMPFLNAVIKESLRLNPILPMLVREASCDDTIPLSIPVKTNSGSVLSHIPITKGQRILLPFSVYNRLSQVWGEDANSWNPRRVMELQAMLFGIIESFEFGLPFEDLDVQRIPSILMVPMIRGQPELGVQLPLKVTQRRGSSSA